MNTIKLYYRETFQRTNAIKDAILSSFIGSTSACRLILEVFIRKKMGFRYFRFSGAILLAIKLSIIPFMPRFLSLFWPMDFGYSFWGTFKEFFIWYFFIMVFLYFSFQRYKETKYLKKNFSFEFFGKSSGELLPFFTDLRYKDKPLSNRTLEIFIEPLSFFIGGIVLIIFGQKLLGGLFIFSAIVYCISYARAYEIGDNFIYDAVDEMIVNEELQNFFLTGQPTQRGFTFRGDTPESKADREKAYASFQDRSEFKEA